MNNFIQYAIAIFKVANTKQQQELFYQQIKMIDHINNTYKDFFKILSCLVISKKERKKIAQQILETLNIDKEVIFWIWIIIENNHFIHFQTIKEQCTLVHHALFNIIKVDVTTAYELNHNQIKKIKDFFIYKLKLNIDLNIKINKELVGGLQIQINNKTYNNTFLSKLGKLKQHLLV